MQIRSSKTGLGTT